MFFDRERRDNGDYPFLFPVLFLDFIERALANRFYVPKLPLDNLYLIHSNCTFKYKKEMQIWWFDENMQYDKCWQTGLYQILDKAKKNPHSDTKCCALHVVELYHGTYIRL